MFVIMVFDKDVYKEYLGLKFAIPVIWLFPVISSIVIISIGATGPSGLWCWINNRHAGLRLGLLLIFPVTIAIAFCEIATVVASIIAKVCSFLLHENAHQQRVKKAGKKLSPKKKAALYFRPFLSAFVICWVSAMDLSLITY